MKASRFLGMFEYPQLAGHNVLEKDCCCPDRLPLSMAAREPYITVYCSKTVSEWNRDPFVSPSIVTSEESPSLSLASTRPDRRAWRVFAVRIIVTLVVLSAVAWYVRVDELAKAVGSISPLPVALAVLLAVASTALTGVAWWVILPAGAGTMPMLEAVRYTIIGGALSALIPTSGVVGDVYRAWAYTKSGGTAVASAWSVIVARWCSIVACTAGLWITWYMFGRMSTTADMNGLRSIMLASASGLTILDLLVGAVLLLPAAFKRVRLPGLASLTDASRLTRELVGQPRFVLALVLCALSLVLDAFCIAAVASAAGQSLTTFLLLGPSVRLLTQVPGFFHGIGPQDLAFTGMAPLFGLAPSVGFSISLVVHGVRLLVSLFGLLLYVFAPLQERGPA
jgi:uncharacterized membrane protein YbhN (UPF0104 family)